MGITPENFLYWPSCNYDAAVPTDLCKCVGVASLPSPRVFFYPFPKTESLFKGYVFLTLQMHYLLLFGYLQSPARGGRVGGWELVVMFIKTKALLKIVQFKVAIGLFFPLVTCSLAQPASNYDDKIKKSTIS